MTLLLFLAGLASPIAGASLFVRGASGSAPSLGVSPLVVGLTVVAFGSSSPEVAGAVGAALDGRTDMAGGSVVVGYCAVCVTDLILAATGSSLLPLYAGTVLPLVVPLTVLALAVLVLRARR